MWLKKQLLRVYVGIVMTLTMLFGCGGGGGGGPEAVYQPPVDPPPVVVTTVDYADFAPFKVSKIGGFTGGQWSSQVINDHTVVVRWGNAADWANAFQERFGLRTYNDTRWVWLDSYASDANPYVYQIISRRAEIRYEGQDWQRVFDSINGQPYALRDMSKSYEIRVWGNILNDEGLCAVMNIHPCNPNPIKFFWAAKYTREAAVHNPCWQGSGSNTRDVIRQAENWWDDNNDARQGVWRNGSGAMGADGEPNGENMVYGRAMSIGKDAGFNWVWKDLGNGQTMCLANSVAY